VSGEVELEAAMRVRKPGTSTLIRVRLRHEVDLRARGAGTKVDQMNTDRCGRFTDKANAERCRRWKQFGDRDWASVLRSFDDRPGNPTYKQLEKGLENRISMHYDCVSRLFQRMLRAPMYSPFYCIQRGACRRR
jgi:hypothetical protein